MNVNIIKHTMVDPETIKETSKAFQEISKTTGKVVDASQKLGSFIAKFIAGPLEQGMGIFEDKLKYMRWENQLNLMAKAELKLKELGLNSPTRNVPLKIAIPLLQAASLEDDESLQEQWANLLVNAANASSDIDVQRSYIDILGALTSLDVCILHAMYSTETMDGLEDGFWTNELPEKAIPAPLLSQEGYEHQPKLEVKLSLANLDRLNLLRVDEAFYGGQLFSKAHRTFLGKSFFDACTLRKR